MQQLDIEKRSSWDYSQPKTLGNLTHLLVNTGGTITSIRMNRRLWRCFKRQLVLQPLFECGVICTDAPLLTSVSPHYVQVTTVLRQTMRIPFSRFSISTARSCCCAPLCGLMVLSLQQLQPAHKWQVFKTE